MGVAWRGEAVQQWLRIALGRGRCEADRNGFAGRGDRLAWTSKHFQNIYEIHNIKKRGLQVHLASWGRVLQFFVRAQTAQAL